ncbi:hypothetical protein EON65_19415 [archaeon]|nr:MAG: hypothetical protein EON65_19415 [archaeon]
MLPVLHIDIVKAQGCILLSTFLGCPASPFATLAAKILAEVSKVAESFAPLVHSGVITSAFRYMKHVRTIHGVGTKVITNHTVMMESRPNTRNSSNSKINSQAQQQQHNAEYPMLLAFLNCFDIIINTGIHASGLYRAYHGYDFIKPAYGTTEAINYQDLLNHLYAQTTFTSSITDYIKRKHVEVNNKHKINAQDNNPANTGQHVRRATIGMKTTSSLTRNMDKILQEVTLLLCNSYLLQELSTIISVTEQMSIVKKALLCLLTLLSSHAHVHIVETITAKAGTLMIRLMQLLEHDDRELSLLALLIFLQCNTMQNSRQSLFIVHIAKFILDLQHRLLMASAGKLPPSRPITSSSAFSYCVSNAPVTPCGYIYNEVFGRLLLLCLSLCRQFDWRFYDIHTLYQQALANGSGSSSSSNDFIKQSIYLNLLITMKVETLDKTKPFSKMTKRLSKQYTSTNLLQDTHTKQHELNLPEPPVITHSNVLTLSVSDYILIPNNFELCLAMSKQYSLFSIQPLLFYLVHPDDIYFYEKLPLHESIAVCQIIEGLSAYSQTAKALYHSSSVLFMMKFIYLNKYLFLGKEMPGINVIMLLNGIKGTFVGLGRICVAICTADCTHMVEEYVSLIKQHEFLSNAMFFLDTLTVFNPTIPLEILQLQKEVGICAVEYFNKYACTLNFLQYDLKREDVGSIEDLYEIAKMCVQVSMQYSCMYPSIYLLH